MDNLNNNEILEYILPKTGLSIPIEIQAKLLSLENYKQGHERYFYEIISARVKEFLALNEHYNENELEIVFHSAIDELAENTAKEITAKFKYEYQSVLIFVLWSVYREMTRNMIDKKFSYRAIDFFKLQNQLETYVKTTGGYSFEEIKEMGRRDPKHIANNAEKTAQQGDVVMLAKEILTKDINQLLTKKDLTELILKVLRHKYLGNSAKLKALPQNAEAIKSRLKKTTIELPAYLSKGGRPENSLIDDKKKLIKELETHYLNT